MCITLCMIFFVIFWNFYLLFPFSERRQGKKKAQKRTSYLKILERIISDIFVNSFVEEHNQIRSSKNKKENRLQFGVSLE